MFDRTFEWGLSLKYDATEIGHWLKKATEWLRPYKISMYNHRKMIYGDLGLVGTELFLRDINDHPEDRKAVGADLFPNLHAQEYEMARSNYLMEQIWTLVKQCAYQIPDIDFIGVEETEEQFMREYLKIRFANNPRGCNASEHMKKALWDCLVSGVGFVTVGVQDDRPYLDYLDWGRVVWDPFADSFHSARRIAYLKRMELWRAIEIWGASKFEDMIGEDGKPLEHCETVEIAFYYDCRDDEGFYGVLRGDKAEEGCEMEWLESGDNPFYSEVDGYRRSRLPVIEVTLFSLPGTMCPVSIVQMMAPAQAMLSVLEQRVYQTANACTGFWDVDANAYDPNELEKFQSGRAGEQILRKAGAAPQWIQGGEINQLDLFLIQHYKQQLMGSGGANPYATGNKVEGVNYAAEVNAIQANANLTAMTVSKAHADHWIRTTGAFLDLAVAIEESPMIIPMGNDQLEVNFGDDSYYLRDLVNLNGTIQVAEATVMFENRAQRIQEAEQAFELSLRAAGYAPMSPIRSYRKVLGAMGERSIDAHFEAPQQAVGAMSAAGATTEGA